MSLITKWLLLKPVLKGLVREAEEEIEHQKATIVISCGGLLIFMVFIVRG